MERIDIIAIEQQARRLRAEEMQRLGGIVGERLHLTGRLLAASLGAGLTAIGNALRQLFSWNPQAHRWH